MSKIHTHYDNLKVTRSAPPEVIRVAYKALAQKFHPDRNAGSLEAAKIMSIINNSYDVLSDPKKRQEHDLWIAKQEKIHEQPAPAAPQPRHHQAHRSNRQNIRNFPKPDSFIAHVIRNWRVYGSLAFLVWIFLTYGQNQPPASPLPYQSQPPTAYVENGAQDGDYLGEDASLAAASYKPEEPMRYVAPTYTRSSTAPNGATWPNFSGYVDGYDQLNMNGLSSVTVDNGQNDSDVFVKLVSLNGLEAYPVRQFYIPAFGRFTLDKVTAGNYDVRYRDLGNGALSRSEQFSLEETETYDGTSYSNITMTLYKVQDGNMQTYDLSESDF